MVYIANIVYIQGEVLSKKKWKRRKRWKNVKESRTEAWLCSWQQMSIFPNRTDFKFSQESNWLPHKWVCQWIHFAWHVGIAICMFHHWVRPLMFLSQKPVLHLTSVWKLSNRKRAAFSVQDLLIYVLQPKYIMSSIAGSCHLVMVTHKEQWQ